MGETHSEVDDVLAFRETWLFLEQVEIHNLKFVVAFVEETTPEPDIAVRSLDVAAQVLSVHLDYGGRGLR